MPGLAEVVETGGTNPTIAAMNGDMPGKRAGLSFRFRSIIKPPV
jgi:hypothetical protein